MNEHPAPPGNADATLVPARVINEHVYCPRLAWLEWEARAFTDNLDTVEGRDAHRRVDVESGSLTESGAPDGCTVITSLSLSSESLGITAKLDRVEQSAGQTIPVEVKHGRPRSGKVAVWNPELAQLTAQVLLLREQGYDVPHAEVFFTETRHRETVTIPDDAERWLRELVTTIREQAAAPTPPEPLIDSPKCPRCSLVGVCLPDETNFLKDLVPERPRRLMAGDDPRSPLYVTTPGAFVRKQRGRLELEERGEVVASRRLIDIAHLAVFGNVTVSSGAVRACLEQDTPILWFSSGGWFSGYAVPHGGSWVARRIAQVRRAGQPDRGLIAASMISGKLRNQRTMLRRLGGDEQQARVQQLADLAQAAARTTDLGALLGIEGAGARLYFDGFPALLTHHGSEFQFDGRNRRPPTDPVNAMLSFAYALLVRDATVACLAAGLDPQIGMFHQPRFGRPSLALDLAEEFRPLVADSSVLMAINNGEIREHDFVRRGNAVALVQSGRKRLIKAYERRVAVTLKHPTYGYQVTYRRAMELQARILAAVIDGQLDSYQPLVTR